MNKSIFMFILYPVFLYAQIDMPPASPDASWNHQLGFTQIEMSYSRPQMRGRKIFGSLVPYNVIWRTGAGESTRIKFSEDVIFGGQPVQKGQYGLYSIPGKEEWTIILNSDATLHGDFGYDEKKDVLRIQVKPRILAETHESFTIELTGFKSNYSASLEMKWENTSIQIPIISNADRKIMAQIKENLIEKKVENAGLLNKGAQYYFLQNKDLNQALEWSKASETLDINNFNYTLLTTNILGRLKLFPEAIKSAEKAMELARKEDKMDEVQTLETRIKDWVKDNFDNQNISTNGQIKIGDKIPNLQLSNSQNSNFELLNFSGKIILVDFWASWCAPCRKANKKLIELYKNHSSQNFEIVGISLDTDRSKWLKAIEKDKIVYTQLTDPHGFDAKSAILFGVEALPASYLFDTSGKLIAINPTDQEIKKILNHIKQ